MTTMIPQGSLHRVTHELLKKSPKKLPEIYSETRLPFYWLKKFSSGEIENPSVTRVQILYEYLAGKELEV